jgi:hypothetical protein
MIFLLLLYPLLYPVVLGYKIYIEDWFREIVLVVNLYFHINLYFHS